MRALRNTRHGLWLEDSLRKRELTMKKHLCQQQGTLPLAACFILYIHLEDTTLFPSGLGTISQTSFFIINWYYFIISYPLFLLYSFFITGRFLIYNITHQSHITGKWISLLSLSNGAFWSTILLYILNNLWIPTWISLFRDNHAGRFLGL